jgi:hypothetical protein
MNGLSRQLPRGFVRNDNKIAASTSESQKIRLSVMYTKQLNKKRKSWSDGILKVCIDRGVYSCTLIDAEDVRELPIDSRQLEPAEIARFQNKLAHQLNLENYLVEVSFEDEASASSSISSAIVQIKPQLKLPRFVPPSRIPKVESKPSNQTLEPSRLKSCELLTAKTTGNSFGGRRYRMTDDEIDDIWEHESAAISSTDQTGECLNAKSVANFVSKPISRAFSQDIDNVAKNGFEGWGVEIQSTVDLNKCRDDLILPNNTTSRQSVADSIVPHQTTNIRGHFEDMWDLNSDNINGQDSATLAAVPHQMPHQIDESIWE